MPRLETSSDPNREQSEVRIRLSNFADRLGQQLEVLIMGESSTYMTRFSL